MNRYTEKMLIIYRNMFWDWMNRIFLKTYAHIEDCARCRDCGRNVHDWHTTNEMFLRVTGHEQGVWCYDCFIARAWGKGIYFDLAELRESK